MVDRCSVTQYCGGRVVNLVWLKEAGKVISFWQISFKMIPRKFTTPMVLLAIFVGLLTIFTLTSHTRLTSSIQHRDSDQYKSGYAYDLNQSSKDVEEDEKILKRINCSDVISRQYYEQRGNYWVLGNYFQAMKTFRCDESITYTTHAEYSFLDNLIPLVERWQGPVSISVYTPGWDFNRTIKTITYLRECTKSSFVKDYVSFHLYFDANRTPKQKISRDSKLYKANCNINPMLTPLKSSYRQLAKLAYPVNMGRMIARDLATTHYILASDIELYPNPGLILDFLDMISRDAPVLRRRKPKVFVLPIFEADFKIEELPRNKGELVELLKNNLVIPFHKHVCQSCHNIPSSGKSSWADAPYHDGFMNIYHIAKRQGKFKFWEPIYIGTKRDPGYDIRLNWEGQRDKMTQGYVLCVLDYEFYILDNAFLIHRPGIKLRSNRTESQVKAWNKQNKVIREHITPELGSLYGKRKGCVLP